MVQILVSSGICGLMAVVQLGLVSSAFLYTSNNHAQYAGKNVAFVAAAKNRIGRMSNNLLAASSSTSDNQEEEDLPCCPSANFPLEFFKTPGNNKTPFNFGPASPLDQILYTAKQPGTIISDGENEGPSIIKVDTVQEWIDYISQQGVTNVITLLSQDELAIYEEPGLKAMLENAGMKCFVSPMGDLGACDRVFAVIRDVEAKGEKVVTHCTGGVGRAGRVAAGWLVHRYSLTPEVATLIVLDQAYESGVKRLGHSEKLSGWLNATSTTTTAGCC